MVKIRLARRGRARRPLYTIVVADSRMSRDGRFLDHLGQYDPSQKQGAELSSVKKESIQSWLNQGASMSDTVRTLLKRNHIQL